METDQGLLVLPLVSPDTQRARISLVVSKPLNLGTNTFPLPEALGGFVLPGRLTVRVDPSLQVSTDVSRMEGLAAEESLEPATDGGDTQLAFRTLASRAGIDAEISQRKREVTVEVHTAVDIDDSRIAVRQQLDYLVKHQPATELTWITSESFSEVSSLQVLLEGQPVALQPMASETTGPQELVIVELTRPMQQDLRLEVLYEWPYQSPQLESPAQVSLPLVVPSDRVVAESARVAAQSPLRASLSMDGPPGYGRSRIRATLSNASPAASSIVEPMSSGRMAERQR